MILGEPLEYAVRALAGACDGARTRDDQGFNSFDAGMGRDLASRPFAQWSPKQKRSAWLMLRKYQVQLDRLGMPYNEIPEPPAEPTMGKAIFISAGTIHIRFPYDPNLVAKVRVIYPQRWWDGNGTKDWCMRAEPPQAAAAVEFAAIHGFSITDDVLDLADSHDPNKVQVPNKNGYVKVEPDRLVITFDYDEWITREMQAVTGATFKKTLKFTGWTTPLTPSAITGVHEIAKKREFRGDVDQLAALAGKMTVLMEQSIEASKAASAEIEIPGLGGELMPFQRAGVVYAIGKERCFIADEQGLGKTIEGLAVLQATNAYPALIVCMKSVKLNWAKEARKWLPGKRLYIMDGQQSTGPPNAEIVIINFARVRKSFDFLVSRGFKALVVDECFVAGTPVDTVNGPIPIEVVQSGDRVFNAAGVGEVIETGSREYAGEFVALRFGGFDVVVTANHPFLTNEGWVRAQCLLTAHYLITSTYAAKTMRTMRATDRQESFLQSILRGEMEDEGSPTGDDRLLAGEDFRALEGCSREKAGMGGVFGSSHEGDKPHALANDQKEDVRVVAGYWASPSRTHGQRAWGDCHGGGLAQGVSSSEVQLYRPDQDSRQGIPDALQDRRGVRGSKAGGGSRREQPLFEAGSGPQERCFSGVVRLESVEILQQGDSRIPAGRIVYNLRVSRHPSYSVASVLVHNCQNLKGKATQQTLAVEQVAMGHVYGFTEDGKINRREKRVVSPEIPIRLFLSGTPIENRAEELIPQLRTLGRLIEVGGERGFQRRFVYSTNGSRDLYTWLRSTCFVRRLKQDVLQELPAKQRSIIPVPITNRQEYNKAEADLIRWLEQTKGWEKAEAARRAEALVRIGQLKQLAARGKMEAVCEWVTSFMEGGNKLVLAAWHHETLTEVFNRFGCPQIHGGISTAKRQEIIDAFQTKPEPRMVALQLKVIGVTLTAASDVGCIELGWNAAQMDQIEDRCHRIGQQDSVNAWWFVGEKTIDVKIAALIEKKRKSIAAVQDGIEDDGASILDELIASLLGGKSADITEKFTDDGPSFEYSEEALLL